MNVLWDAMLLGLHVCSALREHTKIEWVQLSANLAQETHKKSLHPRGPLPVNNASVSYMMSSALCRQGLVVYVCTLEPL